MRKRLELNGWILFLLGCVLFTIQGVVAGDPWAVTGGVTFSVGCLMIFLASFVNR